jgi:5-methylcytosine-specific restriction endonuclease McrA
MDCAWLKMQLDRIRNVAKTWPWSDHDGPRNPFGSQLGPWATINYRYWEADHIVPVCDGGGVCGLDNYRTLCVRCHKADTARLAGSRANNRRIMQ